MDRCRCPEYAEAVKKLRFYTVGTLRPEAIDNYDRSAYSVRWIKHGVDYCDMKFSKPRALRILPDHLLPQEGCLEHMWCPFRTPYKVEAVEDDTDKVKK